jgi:integrase/recombinase XerD
VNVRPFLAGLAAPAGIELDRLDGAAVVSFVVATCPRQTRSSAKRTVKALRSLLAFLHAEGYVDRSLAHAVPAAAGWRLASLPNGSNPNRCRNCSGRVIDRPWSAGGTSRC